MMAAPYVLIQRRRQYRRPRVFRDRTNPLELLDDREIIQTYCLSREAILEVCGLVERYIQRATQRSNSLSVSLQVLSALKFYATGSFQPTTAHVHNISISSVSRSVRDVSMALSAQCNRLIQVPSGQEVYTAMNTFSDKTQFPNVIGAIDGTHILIKAPTIDEHLFVNRKGSHSINVQAVCDANMRIIDIVAKWPGSSHDAFVWSNSALCTKFEDGEIPNGWLLGDSGYPLRPWLLTPVLHPSTDKEERYNAAHARTRSVIERCFGVLKMRFRCLDRSGGILNFSPGRTCRIVVAVAVLHNICLTHNIPVPNNLEVRQVADQEMRNPVYDGRLHDGARTRRHLIENRF